MRGSIHENELCVVGFVYLEVQTPRDCQAPPSGQERFVDGLQLRWGGALNTASVAHALGWPTLLAFPTGNSRFDQAAREAVLDVGLSALCWPAAPGPPVSIVINRSTDRSFLSGARFDAMDGCPQLPVRGWIHVAGLREARRIQTRLAEARARGVGVSVAAAWTPDELEQLRHAPRRLWDLLILNELESSVIASEPGKAIEQLSGVAKAVVITSARTSHAYLDGHVLSVDHAPVDHVVDATGAGDAYCAGLLVALERGADSRAALGYAGRVASRVLSIQGGTVNDATLFENLEPPC